MKDESLTEATIGCAFRVHSALGPGFLEKVYENVLRILLLDRINRIYRINNIGRTGGGAG